MIVSLSVAADHSYKYPINRLFDVCFLRSSRWTVGGQHGIPSQTAEKSRGSLRIRMFGTTFNNGSFGTELLDELGK